MKVIKKGKVEERKNWKKVTCQKDDKYDKEEGCGAILSVTVKDLVMMFFRGTHYRHYYTAIKCPQCGKHNRVMLPDSIWRKLNTEENRSKALFDGFSDD